MHGIFSGISQEISWQNPLEMPSEIPQGIWVISKGILKTLLRWFSDVSLVEFFGETLALISEHISIIIFEEFLGKVVDEFPEKKPVKIL